MTTGTIADEAEVRGKAMRAWLWRAGVEITLDHTGYRGEGERGPEYRLTLGKGGHDYTLPTYSLGLGWPDHRMAALEAGINWLPPILDPEEVDETWQAEYAQDTMYLQAWLEAVDTDGVIRQGIDMTRDLDSGDEAERARAMCWYETGAWPWETA